jgi:hypothetical protein
VTVLGDGTTNETWDNDRYPAHVESELAHGEGQYLFTPVIRNPIDEFDRKQLRSQAAELPPNISNKIDPRAKTAQAWVSHSPQKVQLVRGTEGPTSDLAAETIPFMDKDKNNRRIVLEAVQKDGLALGRASEALQNDYEIVGEALFENPKSIQFASESIRDNPNLMSLFVTEFPEYFEFISTRLQHEDSFLQEILKLNPGLFRYFDREHRSDDKLAIIFTQYCINEIQQLSANPESQAGLLEELANVHLDLINSIMPYPKKYFNMYIDAFIICLDKKSEVVEYIGGTQRKRRHQNANKHARRKTQRVRSHLKK